MYRASKIRFISWLEVIVIILCDIRIALVLPSRLDSYLSMYRAGKIRFISWLEVIVADFGAKTSASIQHWDPTLYLQNVTSH